MQAHLSGSPSAHNDGSESSPDEGMHLKPKWIHITCVLCCLGPGHQLWIEILYTVSTAGPGVSPLVKDFLKGGTDTQVCHSDACPGLRRLFPVLTLPAEGTIPIGPHLTQALETCKENKTNKKNPSSVNWRQNLDLRGLLKLCWPKM